MKCHQLPIYGLMLYGPKRKHVFMPAFYLSHGTGKMKFTELFAPWTVENDVCIYMDIPYNL